MSNNLGFRLYLGFGDFGSIGVRAWVFFIGCKLNFSTVGVLIR